MATTYGVTAADIAAELPGILPSGLTSFTQATKPSLATVTSWIADAEAFIDGVVQDAIERLNAAKALDAAPGTSDRLSQLAKRFIVAEVVLRVMRASYAGRATAADLVALAETYGGATILTQLEAVIEQAIKNIEAPPEAPSVGVSPTVAQRPLLVDDCDLDPRAPRFPFGSSSRGNGIDWGRY